MFALKRTCTQTRIMKLRIYTKYTFPEGKSLNEAIDVFCKSQLLDSVFVMHDKTMLFLSMQRSVVYETFFTRKCAPEIAKWF